MPNEKLNSFRIPIRQLVAEFISDEHDEMRALFYGSLRAIDHALSARREYMTKEEQICLVRDSAAVAASLEGGAPFTSPPRRGPYERGTGLLDTFAV